MASSARNMFNNMMRGNVNGSNGGNGGNNIFAQLQQLRQNSGAILDILLQSGKINNQQYNELQPYKNNPQQIVNYLMNSGNANELNGIMNKVNNQM